MEIGILTCFQCLCLVVANWHIISFLPLLLFGFYLFICYFWLHFFSVYNEWERGKRGEKHYQGTVCLQRHWWASPLIAKTSIDKAFLVILYWSHSPHKRWWQKKFFLYTLRWWRWWCLQSPTAASTPPTKFLSFSLSSPIPFRLPSLSYLPHNRVVSVFDLLSLRHDNHSQSPLELKLTSCSLTIWRKGVVVGLFWLVLFLVFANPLLPKTLPTLFLELALFMILVTTISFSCLIL